MKLKILGHTYEVALVKVDKDLSVGAVGHTDILSQTIQIAAVPSADYRDATLLHEMMHVLSDIGQFNWDEKVVETGAQILMAMLKDNGLWAVSAEWAKLREAEL